MIPLPIPYEDETISSLLMRAAREYGITMSAMKRLLTGRTLSGNPDLDLRFVPYIAKTLGYAMKIEDLYWKHTFLPIYVPYLSKKEALQWGKKSQKIIYSVIKPSASPSYRYYRYCPLCVEEQKKAFGQSYWKREWQAYGGCWCLKHKCVLHITDRPLSKLTLRPQECSGTPLPLTKYGFFGSCLGSYFLKEEREVEIVINPLLTRMRFPENGNLERETSPEKFWLGKFWRTLRIATKGKVSLNPTSQNKLVVFISI